MQNDDNEGRGAGAGAQRTLTAPAAWPHTPDGRYFVVRGRLWRLANPALAPEVRHALVRQLMEARRALRGQRSPEERAQARQQVDQAKRALGERGPVWWSDGAPDFNRHLVRNTPYAGWHEALQHAGSGEGGA